MPGLLASRRQNHKSEAIVHAHLDLARQPDGSWTGFEMTDAASGLLRIWPNYERIPESNRKAWPRCD